MPICHFSGDGVTAYCGKPLGDMVTDRYARDGLEAVTCGTCLELVNRVGYGWPLSCVCVPNPKRWKAEDILICPNCGCLACAKCYQQHREECVGDQEVAYA